MSKQDAAGQTEAPPPVFETWGGFYRFVLATTALVYLLLYLFSFYAR